jgi:hypothetical protein
MQFGIIPGNTDRNIAWRGGDKLCQVLINVTLRGRIFVASYLPISLPGKPISRAQ